MDPVIASYDVKVTLRAPEGSIDEPTIDEIEDAIEKVLVENLSGNGTLVTVNATATRTDE